MTSDAGNGYAVINVRIGQLEKGHDAHDTRISKAEDALGRLYNVPDQIRELKSLIEKIDSKQDARDGAANQNSRTSFWTVLGMGFTSLLFLITIIVGIVEKWAK